MKKSVLICFLSFIRDNLDVNNLLLFWNSTNGCVLCYYMYQTCLVAQGLVEF
uniref:Uncharacterized protein n=1 Tax=Arundo donax TaxID=35708 RepID=A0A0A8XVV6_ARUDO